MRIFAFAAAYAVCAMVFVELTGYAGDDDAPVARNASGGHISAAEASLGFVLRPNAEEHVIMPDWPVRLPAGAPDRKPEIETAHPGLYLQAPEFAVASNQLTRNHRRITGHRLALRTGPGKRFAVTASLNIGEIGEILGHARRGWVPIRIDRTGQQGWVFYRYLGPV